MKLLAFSIALSIAASRVFAARYSKSADISGPDFYEAFHFENLPDPTHGRVTYVDGPTAQRLNLTYATQDTFILRADYTTYLKPSDPGRKSVRIVSNKQYTTFTAVFDMRHMPEGCGTWPAVWTVGANWPNEGEIDIVEGVNSMMPNIASVHTGSHCQMPSTSRNMTGDASGTNCAAYETDNAGCGVKFVEDVNDPISFGPGFNTHQGGWYALERTNSYLKIWFWSRSDRAVPHEVKFGRTKTIHTESWGVPAAVWTDDLCNFPSHFGPHNIVINLALCGDWAGNYWAYKQSGCPDTCEVFVNTNPATFYAAYFDFAGIRIYT
ncbi:glycoside hydrolase family 16 protein [Hydnomerulius pinastri MD-312]|uniref:Glycoside hydrolase family 16 protein n=1 Tax=Hydnomerulius pinastri MD-312 TaxID=994086 RepID=A0A0C9W6T3_9AGAM|nr:glycoside hydrolase family 16 protein [Hydnomerulius pinastri MD-312]